MVPPGFSTRNISLKPTSGRVRLRMPKPTIAASKLASGQERRSASPWIYPMRGARVEPATLGHPAAIMAQLMS